MYKNSLLLSFSSYIQYICIIAIAIIIKTELLIVRVPEEQGVVSVIPHEIRLKVGKSTTANAIYPFGSHYVDKHLQHSITVVRTDTV